jgi:hypothetical protein
MTLASIGVGYTMLMLGSALAIKKPHPSYRVTGGSAVATPSHSAQNVHTDNMFKLPQFHALGTMLVVIASGMWGMNTGFCYCFVRSEISLSF